MTDDPTIPPAHDFAAIMRLVEVIADPVKFAERLKHLEAKAAEVRLAYDNIGVAHAQLEREKAAHKEYLAQMDSAHQAKCAARERELVGQATQLVERERAAEEKFRRGEGMIRMAEMRSADLSNRLHGIGAK